MTEKQSPTSADSSTSPTQANAVVFKGVKDVSERYFKEDDLVDDYSLAIIRSKRAQAGWLRRLFKNDVMSMVTYRALMDYGVHYRISQLMPRGAQAVIYPPHFNPYGNIDYWDIYPSPPRVLSEDEIQLRMRLTEFAARHSNIALITRAGPSNGHLADTMMIFGEPRRAGGVRHVVFQGGKRRTNTGESYKLDPANFFRIIDEAPQDRQSEDPDHWSKAIGEIKPDKDKE